MEIKFNKVSYICTDNATYIKNILSNINTTINDKSITAIMGNSESGKSTMIEMINGIVVPTKGKIEIGNAKIGMVFQNCDDYVIINIFKGIILKLKKLYPIMKTIINTI